MDGRPTIAVIGYSARAAAQSAKRQGFAVIAIDLCADRDLLEDCIAHYRLDDPSWPDMLNSSHPTASLLLTGGMEHRKDWVDRCHLHCIRFGASGIHLQSMRSLANWERWAIASGIGWPKTILATDLETVFADTMSISNWLVKPFQSGGGIGTFDFGRQLRPYNQTDIYLQQKMPGETIGVTFLSSLVGSVLIGATAAWPAESMAPENRYVYRGSYGPIALSNANIDKLQRFAAISGNESGLRGLWQADFLLHEGELTLLEINPRWSASMDILDIGLNLQLVQNHDSSIRGTLSVEALNHLALNARERSMTPPKCMIGKHIVYADQQWVITEAQSNLWWSNRWMMDLQSELNRCWLADIPTTGTNILPGGPILTLITTGYAKETILIALESARLAVRESSVSHLLPSINS